MNGYDQGGLTEDQQGEYLCSMIRSIYSSGYAGGMIFSWQDEWFKQTWNTVKYSPENPKQRTPNVMSPEQSYGLLAVEPGGSQICMLDGSLDDWGEGDIVAENTNYTFYSKYDEGYLYFALKLNERKLNEQKIYIPISTLGVGSRNDRSRNLKFEKNVDFILEVDTDGETRLLSDAYYNTFQYIYGYQKGVFDFNSKFSTNNTGQYVRIQTFLSNEMFLPDDGKTISPKFYESGLLKKGNTDPSSKKFDNTADYYSTDDIIEIRIPWSLLNVVNSSEGAVIGDFYNGGDITFEKITSLSLGVSLGEQTPKMYNINFSPKAESEYHVRLKKSYSIIKDYLKNIE